MTNGPYLGRAPGREEVLYLLHQFLRWDELWITHDALTEQQMRLQKKLTERECATTRTELTKVNARLNAVIDRLQILAAKT